MNYGDVGAIGDFAGVPILTDHRMRWNEMVLMPAGSKPDYTDRSFVLDGCDCTYCRWQPTVRTPSVYGYWAEIAGVDPDPRPVYGCRNLLARHPTLGDFDAVLFSAYGPALREQLNQTNWFLERFPRAPLTRRQRFRRRIRRLPRPRLVWR